MKKYIFLAVLVIFVSSFLYFREDDTAKPPQPVIRVGVECDYAPNNWEEKRPSEFNVPLSDQEGSYAEGYDIQIAKLVAADMGVKLIVRKIEWNGLIPALKNGEIDAIFSGMLDTEERRKQIAFSDTYEVSATEYTIIVNNNSPYVSAKAFSDFAGARIIAQKGTNLDAVIGQIPGVIHEKPTETVQEMLDAIVHRKVDGAVINVDTGRTYEAAYKNLTMIRFPEGSGFKLGFNGVCAGVRKDDTELLHRINKALGGITRNERRRIMDSTVSRLLKGIS